MPKLPKKIREHIERSLEGYSSNPCKFCQKLSYHSPDCPTQEALRWLRKQP